MPDGYLRDAELLPDLALRELVTEAQAERAVLGGGHAPEQVIEQRPLLDLPVGVVGSAELVAERGVPSSPAGACSDKVAFALKASSASSTASTERRRPGQVPRRSAPG